MAIIQAEQLNYQRVIAGSSEIIPSQWHWFVKFQWSMVIMLGEMEVTWRCLFSHGFIFVTVIFHLCNGTWETVAIMWEKNREQYNSYSLVDLILISQWKMEPMRKISQQNPHGCFWCSQGSNPIRAGTRIQVLMGNFTSHSNGHLLEFMIRYHMFWVFVSIRYSMFFLVLKSLDSVEFSAVEHESSWFIDGN